MAGLEEASIILYRPAVQGDLNMCLQQLQQDPFLLNYVSFPHSRNFLHVATLMGQLHIVDEILRRNPLLARELDSQQSSPLHIAAAQGHIGIADKLVEVAPKMMWLRNSQGMNPIHIAAMNGHSGLLKNLVEYDRAATMERLDRSRTVLHLCVQHNQLDALMVLLDGVDLGPFVREKDADGETLLHLAIRCKHVQVMKYLVDNNQVDKNLENLNGETPLEIMHQCYSREIPAPMKNFREFIAFVVNYKLPRKYFAPMNNAIIVVMVLVATIAYQTAISPPGGVWQEDSAQHKVGDPIMASRHPQLYKKFSFYSKTAFTTSIISIFMLATNLPSLSKFLLGIVMLSTWVSMTSLAVSYAACLTMINSHTTTETLENVDYMVLGGSTAIFIFVIVGMFIGYFVKKATQLLRVQALEKFIDGV